MKYLFVGDPHGAEIIQEMITKAEAEDVTHLIFLGDCYDTAGPYDFTNETLQVYFLAGNHEQSHPLPTPKQPNLHVLPKDGSIFQLGEYRVAQLGAIDVEGHDRLKQTKPFLHRQIFHSGYAIAAFDKDAARANLKTEEEIDLFLTHDAPFPFVFSNGETAGSQFITEFIKRLKPKYHLGGHMHYYHTTKINDTPCFQLSDASLMGRGYDCAYLENGILTPAYSK